MPLPLSLALSLLATQVAVEGERGLVSPVVVRLLDDGYRVVPSADDALVRLHVTRDASGDVVLTVVREGGGERSERVPAGAAPVVELEVMQRASLLLAELGAERDADTEGLPGGVVLEVQGAPSAVALARLRARLTAALLEEGFTLVERGREGDRLACVYVEHGDASLRIAREAPCPLPGEPDERTALSSASDVAEALADDPAVAAPRDDAPRGHPFLGRKAPPSSAMWTPLGLSDDPRLSLGIAAETMLPMFTVGPRAELLVPLRRPLVVLVSAALTGMALPPTPYVLTGGSIAVGPAVEIPVVPWLSLRGGLQAGVDVVGVVGLAAGSQSQVIGGASLLAPVAVSWQFLPGVVAEVGGAGGATLGTDGASSGFVARFGVWLGLAWEGSGNFLAGGG